METYRIEPAVKDAVSKDAAIDVQPKRVLGVAL